MYVLTGVQSEQIFKIISLVLSIVISVIIIIDKIIQWYKDAKKDGKITKEELEELKNQTQADFEKLKDDAEEIVEIVEEIEKED